MMWSAEYLALPSAVNAQNVFTFMNTYTYCVHFQVKCMVEIESVAQCRKC